MSRWSPTVQPGYFGPENPGAELANAIGGYRATVRQQKLDTEAEEDRQRRIAKEKELDPIEHALLMANLARQGIRFPGQPTDVDPGMSAPPAMGPGSTFGPGGRPLDIDPGFTAPRGLTPQRNIDPGFDAPPTRGPGGQVLDPGFGEGEGTPRAHLLPGAFNPITNAHNPADIDLGGGYTLPYAESPAGKQEESVRGLEGFGFTPEEALYLSGHPEHIAPFLQHRDAQHNDPYGAEATAFMHDRLATERANRLAELQWERAHPAAAEKPEMTLPQALAAIDQMYGSKDPVTGSISSRLNPATRMRLAQQMMSKGFDPSALGPSPHMGTPPLVRAPGDTGPVSKRHITTDQRDFLKQRKGLTDDQINQSYIVDED